MTVRSKIILACLPVALLGIFISVSRPPRAAALSGSQFQAGRIIDDAVFTNKNAMTVSQIQAFLNAKVPVCDRNRPSSNPSYQPPYTCLKEYQENPTTKENNYGRFNPDGSPYQVPGGKTAAQIIWDAGQTYRINPQVLLVMLQKEQSLVTDDWPWAIQYWRAMGNRCPDGPGGAQCNPDFAGFYNQLDGGAWQIRHDFDGIGTPGYSSAYKQGWNNILYQDPNANPSCGTKSVFIENQATAVLYKYTPYTPNQAALDNLYGTGDSCSAYGNRNFWRIFNDWFGTTTRIQGDIVISQPVRLLSTNPKVGELVYASYTVQNKAPVAMDTGYLWICASMNGRPFGGGSNRALLEPNQELTITYSVLLSETGPLIITACGDFPNGSGWIPGYPYENNGNTRTNGYTVGVSPVVITSGIQTDNPTPAVGESITVSYQLKNTGANVVSSGSVWICTFTPLRGFGGGSQKVPLAPNEMLDISYTFTLTDTGGTTFSVCGNTPGGPGWVASYPAGLAGTKRSLSQQVLESPIKVDASPNADISNLSVGNQVTVSYSIKNTGTKPIATGSIWLCIQSGASFFGAAGLKQTLAPGVSAIGTYTFVLSQTGTLKLIMCGNTPGGPGWVPGYPKALSGQNTQTSFPVSASKTKITDGLKSSSTSLTVGQATTLSYTVRNDSLNSTDTGSLWICVNNAGRITGGGGNRQTLLPNQTLTISLNVTSDLKGTISAWVCGNTPGGPGWVPNYPSGGTQSIQIPVN